MKIDRACEVTVVYTLDEFRTNGEALRICLNILHDSTNENTPLYDKIQKIKKAIDDVQRVAL
uniref:Uncharacterized protein n=1 Tax=viral metagenome TaxID=1070528 RepID=A0A6M3M553_9ZZZZ